MHQLKEFKRWRLISEIIIQNQYYMHSNSTTYIKYSYEMGDEGQLILAEYSLADDFEWYKNMFQGILKLHIFPDSQISNTWLEVCNVLVTITVVFMQLILLLDTIIKWIVDLHFSKLLVNDTHSKEWKRFNQQWR